MMCRCSGVTGCTEAEPEYALEVARAECLGQANNLAGPVVRGTGGKAGTRPFAHNMRTFNIWC